MVKPGLAPRRSAHWMIGQVTGEERLLSELLPRAVERLEPADRAFAQRLATDTLRWMDRADRMLGPHLKKKPPETVLNLLRMATVEICAGGAPPHAVVDAAVAIQRADRNRSSLAGMVNAVLRKIAEEGPERWNGLPEPRLQKWLRGPMVAAWGKETVAQVELAHAVGAPLDLTPKDGNAAALAANVGGLALPTGSVRLTEPGQVTALSGYKTGDWWVQDAAAALPALVLGAEPGMRVLDMCAAPGGKTLQLAAAGAEVTALDASEDRMTRVRENLSRTGLNAHTVVADARTWTPDAPFDAILLDAPCSATGTIRRHADLPYAKDGGGFLDLFALQEALIDHAIALLRPGGRLIYCTCSLLPDEGEVQAEETLARHPSLKLDPEALDRPWIEERWRVDEGLRLRPDFWAERGGMDGFFIAAFRTSG